MLDNILTALWLALAPAVLWAVPRTRRMTGDWMTALRNVPPGCLVTFLLPVLAYFCLDFLGNEKELFILRRVWHPFWIGVFSILAGLGLIAFLNRVSHSRHPPERKTSFLPYVAVYVFYAVTAIVLSTLISFAVMMRNSSGFRGNWRTSLLPPENGVRVAFQQAAIHPFLAEYDYRLRFRSGSSEEYHALQTNTGGRTHFNLYRLKDGRLLFSDKDHDYLVDVPSRKIDYLFRQGGKLYTVPYPNCRFYSCGRSESGGVVEFTFDGKTVKASPVDPALLEGKTYYGCLTDDFYSASEKGETPVEKRNPF